MKKTKKNWSKPIVSSLSIKRETTQAKNPANLEVGAPTRTSS